MIDIKILGTASLMPTRQRNHNGYFIRWNHYGLLFDPGEGTQRQMIFAGIAPSAVTHILISHFHGDHCLGLPGVLQKIAGATQNPVTIVYPGENESMFEHLLLSSHSEVSATIIRRPVTADQPLVFTDGTIEIYGYPLDHRIPTFGYRISKRGNIRIDKEKIATAQLPGPVIGMLKSAEQVTWNDSIYRLTDYSYQTESVSVAFVLDTRPCPGAKKCLMDARAAIMESTYINTDVALAVKYKHLTIGEALQLAESSNTKEVIFTHFSQRYPSTSLYKEDVRSDKVIFHFAEDLDEYNLDERVVTL